jgi:hypothetical protein
LSLTSCSPCHDWARNPLAPHLANREGNKNPNKASDLEPVSGFEPLTVRLQGGCSAKLSYTGRLVQVWFHPESLSGYRVQTVPR